MGLVGAAEGGERAVGRDGAALAVDPLWLDRVEPRAFNRQAAGDDPHAYSGGLDLAVVDAEPGPDFLADVPGGVIPDQQQRRLPCRRQTLDAPRQEALLTWDSGGAAGCWCATRRMKALRTPDDTGYRCPPAISGHTVWRYCRFALSDRDVAELLAARGVVLTDETVRRWCRKCGQQYANARRRHRPRAGDTWHLDAVFVGINGVTHARWRAVDQDGTILAILGQSRRDKAATTKFFRTLLKGLAYVPRVIITDTLASDAAAKRAVLPRVEHRQHQRLNNRAEHAHQPTRERERRMRRCKSAGQAQRFLAAYGPIVGHFRPRRHRLTAASYHQTRDERFATWRAITGIPALA